MLDGVVTSKCFSSKVQSRVGHRIDGGGGHWGRLLMGSLSLVVVVVVHWGASGHCITGRLMYHRHRHLHHCHCRSSVAALADYALCHCSRCRHHAGAGAGMGTGAAV